MEALATYLMKSSVWLTGFALVYALFLRNERFFVLNRIYLVSGILFSMIFPLFTWHYTVLLPVVPNVEISEPQVQGILVPEESFNPQNLLLLAYLAGILYLTYRILRQTLPVFRIIRKSETQLYSSAKLIRTDAYPASFSFFSFVFVNPSIDEIETNEIVNHELEHIRQQHWIDLLLFEILRTMQWFNPVSWLYGHLIRQNHEYLADERALQRSSNPAIYRAALLNQMFGGPVISLANSFNYSLNKKRFNMMKHTIKSPFRKLKLLLVLPLMAGVFYAFATPEYQFVQTENNNVVQESRTVTGKVVSEDGKPLKGASVVVSGKTIGTVSDASGNFKLVLTDDSPIVVSYVGFGSQNVKPDFEKEMVVTMKRNIVSIDFNNQTSVPRKKKPIDIKNSNVLIIVDGNEISKYELSRINPDKIASIDVIKDKASIEKYGEKGKNGVVEITTKKKTSNLEKGSVTNLTGNFVAIDSNDKTPASSGLNFSAKKIQGVFKNETTVIKADSIYADFGKTNSLLFIDGKESTKAEIDNLNPNFIESVSVLKGESATILYGEKGKNGVILITIKKSETTNIEPIDVKVTGYANDQKVNRPKAGINIRNSGTSGDEPKPLIVIDGVIAENQNMDKVDPETIESINVLKNESATKKYGEKAKNGVVEITLKHPEEAGIIVESLPEFPGGIEALKKFVASSMEYPAIALENGIHGQVVVGFVVSKTGEITDVKVKSGVDPSLDKEAMRIVKSMPRWIPGKQNGVGVDVFYKLPISFNLPKDYHPISKEKLKTK